LGAALTFGVGGGSGFATGGGVGAGSGGTTPAARSPDGAASMRTRIIGGAGGAGLAGIRRNAATIAP
jgi:hypothetical protein